MLAFVGSIKVEEPSLMQHWDREANLVGGSGSQCFREQARRRALGLRALPLLSDPNARDFHSAFWA